MKVFGILTIALIALLGLMFVGCGEDMNPISPTLEDLEDGTTGTETLGELKQNAVTVPPTTATNTDSTLRIVRTVPATIGGVAAAPSILNIQDGEDLEIEVEAEVGDDGVIVTVTADEGHIISRDILKLYYNEDEYVDKIKIDTGKYYESLDILVEIDEFPHNEEVTISVHVERDGDTIAEEESDEFTIVVAVEVEVESVQVTDDDEITLEMDEDVEVSSRRHSIRNVTVTNDGQDVDIKSIVSDDDEIVITFEDDLEAGDYTVAYNGEEGLEVDENPSSAFSYDFNVEVEVADEQDDDDDDIATDDQEAPTADVWMTVKTGVLSSDGTVVTGALVAEGISLTNWARECIRNASWEVRSVGSVDLHVVTETDLGLGASYSIGQVKAAVVAAGYSLVPREAAVMARFLHRNQDADEHLMFVSDYLRFENKDHLLVVTGKAYQRPAGDWLAAHRFSNGDASGVVSDHKFVVTR